MIYLFPEEAHHTCCFRGALVFAKLHSQLHRCKQQVPLIISQRVHCPRFDQRLRAPLPTYLGSTRVQKSASVLKGPPSLRARTISPIRPSPMPLIARRPKRTLSPSTVNPLSLLLTSGPSTSTPMRLHSAMALAIFLASEASVVIVAAMNSAV